MKRLFNLIVMSLVFYAVPLSAQSIQNSVVSCTGASVTSGGISMSYTIGEPVIETFSGGNRDLTQGFHQSRLTVTAIENLEVLSEINVYPNPAKYYVNIDIPQGNYNIDISIFDAMGKLVFSQKNVSEYHSIDVAHFTTGTYYLQILNLKDKESKTFKIIKSN